MREFLECFSVMLNMDRLVAPPRAGDEFGALDGVRTLSMMWVVLGHVLIYALSGPGFTNTIDILPRNGEGLLARYAYDDILNALILSLLLSRPGMYFFESYHTTVVV